MPFHPLASPHRASAYEKKSHKGKKWAVISMLIFRLFNFRLFKGCCCFFIRCFIHSITHTSSRAKWQESRKIRRLFNLIFRSFLLSFHNKMAPCDKITIYHSFNVNSTSRCQLCCCVYSSTFLASSSFGVWLNLMSDAVRNEKGRPPMYRVKKFDFPTRLIAFSICIILALDIRLEATWWRTKRWRNEWEKKRRRKEMKINQVDYWRYYRR